LHPGSIPGEASNFRRRNRAARRASRSKSCEPMASTPPVDDFATRRQHMVDGQLRTSGVTDQAVLSAFAETPREAFVEPAVASLAYLDRPAPALNGGGRVLIEPMVLARLIQAANVQPGARALDVAGGSGYSAAILARLGAHVVALDLPAAGAGARGLIGGEPGIEIVAGELAEGAPAKAPFDAIVINGAFEILPEKLLQQLAEGGRLVGVDASFAASKAVLIEKIGGATSRRVLFDAGAPRLDAFKRPAEFAF
jgi:protein-L-isoaspartate(D-aspartate) O-methyltransferase